MGGYYSVAALSQWWIEGSRYYGKSGIQNKIKQNKAWEQIHTLIANNKSSTDRKNIIVTGANSGIGYQCALQLGKSGARVHMLCRNVGRGEVALKKISEETGNDNIILHQVDMSNKESIKQFADSFFKDGKNDRLDALINNAGVVMQERQTNEDGVEICFATAMGGTFLLSSLCLNSLKKAQGRVVNISSGGMYLAKFYPKFIREDIYKGKYDGLLAYVQSKRCQVLLNKRWATKLKEQGIVFHSYHPGWSATPGVKTSQMSWFYEKKEDELRNELEGADTAIWLTLSNDDTITRSQNNGSFWFDRSIVKEHFPFAWTRNTDLEVDELWKYCVEIFEHEPEI
jgi:dehydrogenase/reductase SDR family member 12